MNSAGKYSNGNWTPVTPPFSTDTIVEEIILSYPFEKIKNTFSSVGIHCVNCPVGPEDNLKTVAFLHEMDQNTLINRLNDHLEDTDPLEEPSYYD